MIYGAVPEMTKGTPCKGAYRWFKSIPHLH